MVVIKIDTKKDSADDIKKTIEFLQKFLEPGSSGSYDSIAPGTMDIFSKDDNNDNNNLDSDEDMKIKPMFY